jgi:hypothetical protein
MKTMFVAAPFGNTGLAFRPAHAASVQLGASRPLPRLGQDFLEELGIGSLLEDIQGLLGDLPSDLLGKYQSEYDACVEDLGNILTAPKGVRCLRDLYRELKDLRDKPTSTPISVTPPKPPPEEGFPVLLVAGGAVGAALLIYLVVRLAKKS